MIPVDLESDDTALAREPQQARSRRTLEHLREAAWQLLENDGIEAVTVTGVAAGAGVSVGSFYARFEGKEELLDHLEAVALEASLRSWRDAAAEVDTADLLAHLVHLYRRGPARRLLLLSRADGRSPDRLDRLQEAVARALAEALGRPGADPQAPGGSDLLRGAALAGAARELALAVEGPARRWLFNEDATAGADQPILEALLGMIGSGTPGAVAQGASGGGAEPDEPRELAPARELADDRDTTPTEEIAPTQDPAPTSGTAPPPSSPDPDPDPDPEPDPDPATPPPPVELFDVWG